MRSRCETGSSKTLRDDEAAALIRQPFDSGAGTPRPLRELALPPMAPPEELRRSRRTRQRDYHSDGAGLGVPPGKAGAEDYAEAITPFVKACDCAGRGVTTAPAHSFTSTESKRAADEGGMRKPIQIKTGRFF